MFRDRADAGQQLARKLAGFTDRPDVVVVGLLRGGVPVAFEIAQALHVPLDVLLVRKLGVPGQPELAMGAIASGGIKIIDRQMVHAMGLSREQVDTVVTLQTAELHRREQLYGDVLPGINMKDRIVIVVDDGIATGASMLAAVAVLRLQHPKEIIIATPVAPLHAQREMEKIADQFICLHLTDNFSAVGAFYKNFSQTEDREVRSLLIQAPKCGAKTHH
jgi:putative phosphoribosyl transferase